MPTENHHEAAAGQTARCAVLTISDTRTPESDTSGAAIRRLLETAGHTVMGYAVVKDEVAQIESQLRDWLGAGKVDLILTTGGTGIARRDTTIEVAERLIDKPMPGFGELFRMLSYDQIGPAAMLSRAVAGLSGETFIFAMPGSTKAVTLAMEKLILPELPHLVWERGK